LQRAGYATDPAYADKIVAVAEQIQRIAPVNNVTAFKSAPSAPLTDATSTNAPRVNSNG
jgi:flagellum-specific peptidoglycan hydrolase FlgJ